jgi:hypothetical protein
VPGVGEDQAHAGIEEGKLAKAVLELVEVELDDLEGGRGGQEGDAVPLLVAAGPDHLQGAFRHRRGEAHVILFAVPPDGEVKPLGKAVDTRARRRRVRPPDTL